MTLNTQCQVCATCQSKVCSFAGGQLPTTTQLTNLFGETTTQTHELPVVPKAPVMPSVQRVHDEWLDTYQHDLDRGW